MFTMQPNSVSKAMITVVLPGTSCPACPGAPPGAVGGPGPAGGRGGR